MPIRVITLKHPKKIPVISPNEIHGEYTIARMTLPEILTKEKYKLFMETVPLLLDGCYGGVVELDVNQDEDSQEFACELVSTINPLDKITVKTTESVSGEDYIHTFTFHNPELPGNRQVMQQIQLQYQEVLPEKIDLAPQSNDVINIELTKAPTSVLPNRSPHHLQNEQASFYDQHPITCWVAGGLVAAASLPFLMLAVKIVAISLTLAALISAACLIGAASLVAFMALKDWMFPAKEEEKMNAHLTDLPVCTADVRPPPKFIDPAAIATVVEGKVPEEAYELQLNATIDPQLVSFMEKVILSFLNTMVGMFQLSSSLGASINHTLLAPPKPNKKNDVMLGLSAPSILVN